MIITVENDIKISSNVAAGGTLLQFVPIETGGMRKGAAFLELTDRSASVDTLTVSLESGVLLREGHFLTCATFSVINQTRTPPWIDMQQITRFGDYLRWRVVAGGSWQSTFWATFNLKIVAREVVAPRSQQRMV